MKSKSSFDKVTDNRYLVTSEPESKKNKDENVETKIVEKAETGPIIPAQSKAMSKDLQKTIAFGAKIAGIGIAAGILYSPGLIALSVFDASIFKATLAVVLGIVLVAGLAHSTFQYFRPDKKQIKTVNASLDVTELTKKLTEHIYDDYMGDLAKQAVTQVDRLNKTIKKVEFEIGEKFVPNTMTYKNFYSSVDVAGDYAFKNLSNFVTRLRLYDDQDYAMIKTYKHDAIPDNIQEEQIELIKQNKQLAADALNANEQLIIGLEKLAMKLADSNFEAESDKNDELLENINKLTETIKYYI